MITPPPVMLNDTEKLLIAASLDGDLDPNQEAEFRRLLAEIAEAAALHQQLVSDRARLQSLRRFTAPADLVGRIFERIGTNSPRQLVRQSASTSRASWIAYVIAASVFLAVSLGSFWLSLTSNENGGADRSERLALPRTSSNVETSSARNLANRGGFEALPPPRRSIPTPIEPRDDGALASQKTSRNSPESAPLPRSRSNREVVGSRPTSDVPDLNAARIRLPLLDGISEFDRPEVKARLQAELSDEPAHRLDLFVRDPLRSVEVFQTAARSTGLPVTIDAVAQERIKRRLPTSWLIYTESLTADEIVKLLGQLAVLTRNDPSPVLVSGHLVPAQAAEARDLRDLLGLDPGVWKRPKANLPKPISAGTVDELTASLSKKNPAKSAILVPYYPPGHRPPFVLTKDVKTFLDRREDRKSNAVPLLIVIRPAS